MKDSPIAQLKKDKQSGRRAYSDAPGHILVRFHGEEHGMDLSEARQLLADLQRALAIAAAPKPQ